MASARAADTMPNRPAFFRSMRPLLGLEAAEPAEARLVRAGRLHQQLGEGGLPARRRRRPRATARRASARVAVHAAQVEEDVDRQQVLRPRAADPAADARAPGGERAAPVPGSWPSRRPCSRARRPRAGCRRRARRARRTSGPRARPARRRRRPGRCPGPWRAGSRRGRPSRARRPRRGRAAPPRPAAAQALLGEHGGAPRQVAELAARSPRRSSRPDTPSAQQAARRPAAASPRHGRGRARPRPRRSRRRASTASSARSRSRSRADSAPTTRPASSVTPRWRDAQPAHAADGAVDEVVGRARLRAGWLMMPPIPARRGRRRPPRPARAARRAR